MKKRMISIVLLVVLVCSLALTVSAECDHTYMLIYTDHQYFYYDDVQCEYDTVEHYTCTKCHDNYTDRIPGLRYDHVFGDPVYVGTLASGLEWWYHDCINCGTRIDFYVE